MVVSDDPVQVRPRDTSGLAHAANDLSTLDRVPDRDRRRAQVEVAGDESGAVHDVDDRPGQVKVGDECDDPRFVARTGSPILPRKSTPVCRDVSVPLNLRPLANPLVIRLARGFMNGSRQSGGVASAIAPTVRASSLSPSMRRVTFDVAGRLNSAATRRRSGFAALATTAGGGAVTPSTVSRATIFSSLNRYRSAARTVVTSSGTAASATNAAPVSRRNMTGSSATRPQIACIESPAAVITMRVPGAGCAGRQKSVIGGFVAPFAPAAAESATCVVSPPPQSVGCAVAEGAA